MSSTDGRRPAVEITELGQTRPARRLYICPSPGCREYEIFDRGCAVLDVGDFEPICPVHDCPMICEE